MVKRKVAAPKHPKRQYVPSAFTELPAGQCYLCRQLIWNKDELTMVNVEEQPRRRHIRACISAEVPW